MTEDSTAELEAGEGAEPAVDDATEAAEGGGGAEGGEGAEGAEGEAPAGEAPLEWTPPMELNLPEEVVGALQTLMNALLEFGRTVPAMLDESHSRVAEEAATVDPLYMPEGLSTIVNVIGEWSSQVDGLLVPFKEYIERIGREREPISDYLAALQAHFAPPPPPVEAGEEGEGGEVAGEDGEVAEDTA